MYKLVNTKNVNIQNSDQKNSKYKKIVISKM